MLLMAKMRNICTVDIGRNANAANIKIDNFQKSKFISDEAIKVIGTA